MSEPAAHILAQLDLVAQERARRLADAPLASRVLEVKAFQQRRFAESHADLLAHPRYAAAARFFLDDLYGPQDFAERDAQFVRIVPALVRLFPGEIVATVASLAELHALSEALDSDMGQRLATAVAGIAGAGAAAGLVSGGELDRAGYVQTWRDTGRAGDRARQIDLVIAVGRQLDKYTRNRWLRQSLKLMRAPARAAGLASLQSFLEKGFDTFAGMGRADEFLATIEARERAVVAALFDPAQPDPLRH